MRTLIIIMLILIASIFFLTSVSAEITIDGETVCVETDKYEIQFDRGVITHIHNKHTDEIYTVDTDLPEWERAWSGLLNHRHFWNNANIPTRAATRISAEKIDNLHAELVYRQGGTDIRFFITVDPMTDDLLIDIEGASDTPGVVGMQWGIGFLDLANSSLIAPVDGGRIINATTPVDYVGYPYPSSGQGWEAQLAIVQGEHGGFFVRNTDDTFQFKRLIYDRDDAAFNLNFTTFNQAPFDTHTHAQSMRWRFNTYTGDWRVPARIYRDWMETTFNPRRLSDMPAWVEDIGLFVGSPKSGSVQVKGIGFLDKLAEQVDPTKTLLLVMNWNASSYPDYEPKPELGRFVEAAHQHGFRVMPYVNLHGFSPDHPLYPEFEKYQYRDPWTGERLGWWWNTTSTHRHAFINPASAAYRKIFVQELLAVWQEYRVDGFFLDTSWFVVNDANGLIDGLNAGQGNSLLHKELAEAMPGVAFGGERLHEVSFVRESFAQRPLLAPQVKPHPISAFLFSPYTHAIGFLPNPDDATALYQQHMSFHESWGVLPTLDALFVNQLESDRVETQRLLSIARTWQQFGLKPDFDSDWTPDTLFNYIGQNGEIATFQETPTGSILILPQGNVGYERVFGTTQVKTDRSLPGWYAYDETTIFGLNPTQSYLLSKTPRDLSQPRINSLPKGILVTEQRVTDNAALFRLEDTGGSDEAAQIGFYLPNPPIRNFPEPVRHIGQRQYTLDTELPAQVLFLFEPTQQVVSPHNLRNTPFVAGLQVQGIFMIGSVWGSGQRRWGTAAGVQKKTIGAHPPEGGQTVIQFLLGLPEAEEITFSFSMGLTSSGCSTGVIFQVLVNGQPQLEHATSQVGWTDAEISLSAFAGEPVLLELVTDPDGSAICDGSDWGDLLITVEAPEPNGDVNQDGVVNVLDLILIAQSFGEQLPSNPQVDVNKDGVVNLLDLVFVAKSLSQNAAAPSQLNLIKSIPSTAKEIIAAQRALNELEAMPNKTPHVKIAIELLRHYLSLADRNVQETKLLPNYPNPFNPDTWIPYQLSEGSTVTVKIYDVTGSLIRIIEVGHKPVGYYLTRERAVYWDGRNEKGEPISSGVYFYTLNTGTYTQTRRMVIAK